ncbi:unnamed protein product [Diplocarpon coronariae]|nr:hypothetical protein JHW43_005986 [Diplocarpon mali]
MQSPQLPPHRLRTAGILTDFPYVSTQTVWSTWVKGTIAVFVAAAPQKRQILLGPVPEYASACVCFAYKICMRNGESLEAISDTRFRGTNDFCDEVTLCAAVARCKGTEICAVEKYIIELSEI